MTIDPLTDAGAAPQRPPEGPQPPQEARKPLVLPWHGAVAGVGAGAVYFLSCLLLMLLVSASGLADALGDSTRSLGSALSDAVADSVLSGLPVVAAQLGAMGLLGPLGGEGYVPLFGRWRGSLFAVPLGLTLLAAALAFAAAWLQARLATPARAKDRAAQAAALGLGFALTTTIIAAALPFQLGDSAVLLRLSAAGIIPFAVALALGTASGWAGLGLGKQASLAPAISAGSPVGRLAATLAPGLWAFAGHATVFAAVALPAVWVTVSVQNGWSAAFSGLLWVGHAVAGAFALGHLGGVAASSTAYGSGTERFYHVFGGDPASIPVWAALLLVLLALVSLAASGTVLALARGAVQRGWASAWVTPSVFAAAGLLAGALLQFSLRLDLAAFGTSGDWKASAGAPWWFPAVLAFWGLAAELVSRTAAPYILGLLPQGWVARAAAVLAPAPRTTAMLAAQPGPPPSSAGTEIPAPGAADDLPAQPVEVRTLSPRGRRRALTVLTALAGAGALVAAGAVAVALVKAGKGPDAPVRAYLDAVVAGRAQEAMEKASPNLPTDARALLADEVYAKASKRIDRYSIVSTEETADTAVVVAELGQDGRTKRQTFIVSKREPGLLDDHWTVDSGSLVQAITVSANTKNPQLVVNGVAVTAAPSEVEAGRYGLGTGPDRAPDGWLSERGTIATFYALPGEYTLGLGGLSPLLEADEQSVSVTIGGQAPEGARIEAVPSRAFRDQLDASVKALVDRCLSRTALDASSHADRACPFSRAGWSGYDYRNIRWTLTEAAAYGLGGRVYSDGAVQVVAEDPGTAQITYQRKSTSPFAADDPYRDDKETVAFTLAGAAVVKDGKVEFAYAPYGSYSPK